MVPLSWKCLSFLFQGYITTMYTLQQFAGEVCLHTFNRRRR